MTQVEMGKSVSNHRSLHKSMQEMTLDIDSFVLQLRSLRSKLKSCSRIVSSFSELSNGLSLSENGKSLRELAVAAADQGERTT